MRIIDSHVHIWDLTTGLYPGFEKPSTGFVGDNAPIARSYLLPELLAESADAADLDIAGLVHVEAFPTDQLAETSYLQSLADGSGHGFPQALVVNVDLAADDAEAQLEAQRAFANTRGIRQVLNQHSNPFYSYGVPDNIANPLWRQNFALLKQFGLSFDLQIYPHQVADIVSVIDANPDVSIILNHACMPIERTAESFASWRRAMTNLAKRDNVAVKVSGLGMFDHHWTLDSFRPYVFETIDLFGVDRVMFASNFPVDKLFSTYRDLWHAFFALTENFTDVEQIKLYAANAERLYRL